MENISVLVVLAFLVILLALSSGTLSERIKIRKGILYGVGGFWFGFGGFLVIDGLYQWKLPFDASLLGLGLTLIGLSYIFWGKAKSLSARHASHLIGGK